MPEIAVCTNCGFKRKIKGKKECVRCWNYEWRNGVKRPPADILPGSRKNPFAFCRWCKEREVLALGLCVSCYFYQWRTGGQKRPVHMRNRSMDKGNCKNPHCKKPLKLVEHKIKGYCSLCYRYDWEYKINRPARLTRFISDPENGYYPCLNSNCDKPIKFTYKNKGYCYPCKRWFSTYCNDRPRELCPQAIRLGWCECGKLAIIEVEIYLGVNGKTADTLILCQECYGDFV